MRPFAILMLLAAAAAAQSSQDSFPGVQQWATALNSADPGALPGLYSRNPPAQFIGSNHQPQDISAEFSFWQQLKAGGAHNIQTSLGESSDKSGLHIVVLLVKFQTQTPAGERTRYVFEQQGWQQQDGVWRIAVATHSNVVKMPQPPTLNPNLYPPNVDANAEIRHAIARSTREHKRILLIFGGNWCYDCHVLDYALHQSDAAPIASQSFVIVHVDIGEGKLNPDLVSKYQIPLAKGVPALAVLDSDGKLLYSAHGEFEKARSMDPDDLIAFLKKWAL